MFEDECNCLELYGVQYIGKKGNGYEYECVIFDEYKVNQDNIIVISNILLDHTIYMEAPIKQFSDTCLHFILSDYYDPSIYDFTIRDLWH